MSQEQRDSKFVVFPLKPGCRPRKSRSSSLCDLSTTGQAIVVWSTETLINQKLSLSFSMCLQSLWVHYLCTILKRKDSVLVFSWPCPPVQKWEKQRGPFMLYRTCSRWSAILGLVTRGCMFIGIQCAVMKSPTSAIVLNLSQWGLHSTSIIANQTLL